MSTLIAFEQTGGVATITLVPSAPHRPPTLDHGVLDRLDLVLDEVTRRAESLRVLHVCSGSPKFFCVGADLGSLREISAETIAAWVEHGHRVFNRLEDLPMPTVACVEGYALGGGLELALACDLIFASETAHCGQPEGKLGFVAGWGGSWRLPRRIGVPAAKRLFFTGEILPAAEALRLGLVDLVATGRPLEEPLKAFDAQVLAGSAVAARQHKLLLASAFTATREEAGQYEAEASESCLVTDDTRARLDAFFAKRK